MVKYSFFQFELEPRVFGLWKWSIHEKTGFFLNFFNFQILVDFDHFWPNFEYQTQGPDSWFFTIFQIDTSRFLLKTRSNWSKPTKIYKFGKLRKNPVFWHPDHCRSPKTRSSSSNRRLTIFQFFRFLSAWKRA